MKQLFFLLFSVPLLLKAQPFDSFPNEQFDSLINISNALVDKLELDSALEVNTSAEKFALNNLGHTSAEYGHVCHNYGRIFSLKRDYQASEKWYLEAKTIREKVLGNDHADYAETLLSLGEVYQTLRNNEQASTLYLEASKIRKKCFGAESEEYRYTLTRLVWIYTGLTKYEEALSFGVELQQLDEKTKGKTHPNYAQSLFYLATLYRSMSRFEVAEPYYVEAKEIFEAVPYGRQNPFFLQTLDGLGALFYFMGRYSEAEPFWIEVRDVREKTMGKENDAYALSQLRLGLIYNRTNRPQEAEAKWLEAKNIYVKLFGPNHFMVAACKTNLGLLYSESGRFKEAEEFLLESISIIGKNYSNRIAHLNLARLYEIQARYNEAEKQLLEAISIWKESSLEDDPEFPMYGINFLAYIYEKQGRLADADSLLNKGSGLIRDILTKSITYLSEKELGSYLRLFEKHSNHLLSFIMTSQGENGWLSRGQSELIGTCYDYALFNKGYLLHSAIKIKSDNFLGTANASKHLELTAIKAQLAKKYSRKNTDDPELQLLEGKANLIEKELTKSVAGYGDALQQVSWKEVQQHLKKTDIAIEFVHYQFGKWAYISDSIFYAALLLRPGEKPPLYIPLFEEKQLSEILTPKKNEQQALVYSRGIKPLSLGETAGLYELLWQPLDSLLLEANTVYFSPSGLLHRINFDAIQIPNGEANRMDVLSDKFRLVRLGSTRSLAVPDLRASGFGNDAVLFGGIQYDIDTTLFTQDSMAQDYFETTPGELSFAAADRGIRQREENWGYLPGSLIEVLSIDTLLKKSNFSTQVYSGERATEEALKVLGADDKSPRILHIATHGFFFPDPVSYESKHQGIGNEPVFKISDHPMIRSGLILAEGNFAWKTGKSIRPDREDGILTAYEISQMNLSNTNLVVLSACETGLGDIQGKEGVYGLQRAFKIAGAKYLIMSLWQVPDKQTSLLMTTFYKKWLEDKMEIPEAFRAAQKELRDFGLDPYQWAGFVLVE